MEQIVYVRKSRN